MMSQKIIVLNKIRVASLVPTNMFRYAQKSKSSFQDHNYKAALFYLERAKELSLACNERYDDIQLTAGLPEHAYLEIGKTQNLMGLCNQLLDSIILEFRRRSA